MREMSDEVQMVFDTMAEVARSYIEDIIPPESPEWIMATYSLASAVVHMGQHHIAEHEAGQVDVVNMWSTFLTALVMHLEPFIPENQRAPVPGLMFFHKEEGSDDPGTD